MKDQNDDYQEDYNEKDDNYIHYGHRKRSHELREKRFYLTREVSDGKFNDIMLNGLNDKRRKIKRQKETAEDIAAYAPAGTGSGTPWFCIGPRNVNGRVKFIAVDPTDEDIVYAGAASGGVWKTINGGQSWLPLWNSEDTMSIGSLAIAPSNTNVIYVGTGEWTPNYGPSFPGVGLYVSTDAGSTWNLFDTVTSRRISRVLVSPTDANTVYVAGANGFERSEDGGATWNTLRAGQISDAVIDPTDADVIYIAVRNDRIYKTTDGGVMWNPLNNGPTGSNADWIRLSMGVNGTNGTDFLVAKRSGTLNVTTDGGSMWTPIPGSHGGVSFHSWCNLCSVSPHDEDIILAGGASLTRTDDGGSSWGGVAGLHADHHVAAFALTDVNRVYSCNDGGVYRSDDKGATFEKVSHGMIITQYNDIGSWQKISNVLGGGTQDNGTNMTTSGLTYKKIFGWDGGYFLVDHNDPRTMYAEHQNTDIFKSIDGGNSWTQKVGGLTGATPWVGVITMDPNNSSNLYTGTNRVFRSTNALATDWVSSSQTVGGDVTSIAVSKSDSNRVYVGSEDGNLFRSDDAGATNPWLDRTDALFPNRPLKDVVVDDSDEDIVFAVFGGISGGTVNSVWRSTTGGNSWSNISGDLTDIPVNAICLDPNDSNTYYVGTDVGVYRTTNGGTNWDAFDNGLPNVIIADLHIDPEEEVLYAATFGRGMYKLNIAPGATINPVDLYIRDSLLDTGEIRPSPSGEPDPNDPSKNVYWWQSPDIKTDVNPYYTQDSVFDGVEFDDVLTDEFPERTNPTRFYTQVHNRGWQTGNNLKVRAFIADASAGLPNLPADFWTVFPNSDPSDVSIWTPLGPAKDISVLEPHTPKIVWWDYALPMSTATHTCMLVVVSSVDDPITTTELNVNNLVKNEKRVALRNLHVINSSSPRPSNKISSIRFHNALPVDHLDVIIDPVNFTNGNIGMIFEKGVEINSENLNGVTRYPLREGEFIGEWGVEDKSQEISLADILKDFDTRQVYEFDTAKRSLISNVKVETGKSIRALIVSRGSKKADSRFGQYFDVLQMQEGEIVGGSTYKAQLLEPKKPAVASKIRVTLEKVKILDDHDPWIKGRGEIVFNSSVSFNNSECRTVDKRFPKNGCFKMSDNKKEVDLGLCLYEGYVTLEDNMRIRICPSELDTFNSDDYFEVYNRAFEAPFTTWRGKYAPDSEPQDPEKRKDWEVWIRIEEV